MNIGYLYNLHAYPPKGGNHVHVYELIKGFTSLNHNILVVDDPSMPNVVNYNSNEEGLLEFLEKTDLLYIRIDARPTKKWETLNKCMQIAVGIPIVWEINSPANENLAFSWHGGNFHLNGPEDESLFKRIKRWIHAARKKPEIILEEKHRRKLSKKVNHAICVSAAVGRYAKNYLAIPNVTDLPNGGPILTEDDITRRRLKRSNKQFTVLYSGSAIYPWQGLNFLTQVVAIAKNKAPDILFKFVVNQKTDWLPGSDNVEIQEKLSHEEVLDAICMADVCVALPPKWHWSPYGFHGSPMKLFEYMAGMTPVVTSNHSQMSEILKNKHDAVLTENTPEAILENIIFVKDNPDKAKVIGRNGWQKIQDELNWQNNANVTIDIFKRYLN